jgi:hypothetical protein
MILAALRDKLAARGPLGFATDAAELAAACTVVATWSAICAAGALAGVVVAAPFVAWELLTRPLMPLGHRCCDADRAADRTSCRNAEEPTS